MTRQTSAGLTPDTKFDVDFSTTEDGMVHLAIADLNDGQSVLVPMNPVAAMEFANTLAQYALVANMKRGVATARAEAPTDG